MRRRDCLPGGQVVALDGAGSRLMNLGSLATLARYRPGNLLHVVFDNESRSRWAASPPLPRQGRTSKASPGPRASRAPRRCAPRTSSGGR
jgi:sulfopyruvate decarboxylase subunit beta